MKSGFVAVAGRPNVGKSTLVNALCGEKVAITSTVPNTTRRRIFGVAHGADYQLALVDLPGFQRPIDALTQRMQRTVDDSFDDIDAVLFVVDARERIGAGDRFIARRVFALGKPVIIVVNKIDRLKHAHVASQMKTAATLGDFHALHPVSAKTGDGIGELRGDLVSLLPDGDQYFPAEVATDQAVEERIGAGDRFVARRVFALGVPVVIALNKIDRLKHGHVASQMKAAATLGDFHALHPVSAKVRDGIDELRDDLVLLLPEGPALFPQDQQTDLSLVERIAEVIREKALHLTRDEVPHALTVEVEELDERRVRAFVLVETESQKGILVGKRGATIREIGTRARPEVEKLVGNSVFLELVVKVRPKWRRDERTLERLGL